MSIFAFAVSLAGSVDPASAQVRVSSGSSYSVGGSGLQRSDPRPQGPIVRGYYNRFGEVVATARREPEAASPASDAAAAATTYETPRSAAGKKAVRMNAVVPKR